MLLWLLLLLLTTHAGGVTGAAATSKRAGDASSAMLSGDALEDVSEGTCHMGARPVRGGGLDP